MFRQEKKSLALLHGVQMTSAERASLNTFLNAVMKENPLPRNRQVKKPFTQAGIYGLFFRPEKRFLQHLRSSVKMSHAERASSDAFLQTLMKEHPVPERGVSKNNFTKFKQPGLLLLLTPRVLAVLIVVVLLGGWGTMVVAEGAQPSDFLYPIKVQVSEEIRSAFNFSTASKAHWAIKRADRRLVEVGQLALAGALSAQNRHELIAHLHTHEAEAIQLAAQLNAQGNAEAAVNIISSLETTLSAHGDVMESLLDRLSGPHAAQAASVLQLLALEIRLNANERIALQAQLKNAGVLSISASEQITLADREVKEARSFINTTGTGSEVRARAEARLREAEVALTAAKLRLQEEQYAEVIGFSDYALRYSKKATSIITAGIHLGIIPTSSPAEGSQLPEATTEISDKSSNFSLEEAIRQERERIDHLENRARMLLRDSQPVIPVPDTAVPRREEVAGSRGDIPATPEAGVESSDVEAPILTPPSTPLNLNTTIDTQQGVAL